MRSLQNAAIPRTHARAHFFFFFLLPRDYQAGPRRQTPRHRPVNSGTRPLAPSSSHIASFSTNTWLAGREPTNQERPRRGRVPERNVYVRHGPIGAELRGRGVLLEERGKTIFYPPPDRAAFWIAWAAVAAVTAKNFTCRVRIAVKTRTTRSNSRQSW